MDWNGELASVYRALELADRAGNADDARQLALYALQIEQTIAHTKQQPETPHLLGAPRAALQGATFGFSDELGAGITAVANAALHRSDVIPFWEQVRAEYRGTMDSLKSARDQYRDDHPLLATGLEMAGGMATGGVGGYKVAGVLSRAGLPQFSQLSRLQQAGVMAATGGAEGALYGAGSAEPDERMSGAGAGALVGAVASPLVGGALAALGDAVVKPVATGIRRWALDTPEDQAARAIRGVLDADGVGADDIPKIFDDLGRGGVLADAGPNSQSLAREIANSIGSGRRTISDFLDQRQRGQQGRLMESVERGLGASADDFRSTVRLLERERSAQAAPLYREAYSATLQPTDRLENLMRRPDMEEAVRAAVKIAKNDGRDLDDSGMVEIFDLAKRHLDDKWNVAIRKGERNRARQLRDTINSLVSEMDEQVPAYAQARNVFAGGSSLIDAGTLGRKILTGDIDELGDSLVAMGDSERLLFRMGAVRAVRDEIEKSGATHDAVKRLFRSTDRKNRLQLAFRDEADFERFVKHAEAEATKSSTRAAVQGNSTTAAQLRQSRELGEMADPGILATTGDGVLGMGLALAKRMLGGGMSPAARERIVEMLFQEGMSASDINQIFRRRGLGEIDFKFDRRGAGAPGALAIYSE